MHGRFGTSSTFYLMSTNVHESIEECSGSHDDTFRTKFHSPNGHHTYGFAIFYNQFVSLILPYVEVIGAVKHGSPFPNELPPVALCARTPHGRAFADVEHTKLNGRIVGHQSHLSTQSIDFSDNLSFCDSPHSRVTTHLRYFVHVHCDETCVSTHVCCCCGSFATGVSAPDDDNVILVYHLLSFLVSDFSAKVRN